MQSLLRFLNKVYLSLFFYKFVVFKAKNGIETLLTLIITTRVFFEYEFNDQKIHF